MPEHEKVSPEQAPAVDETEEREEEEEEKVDKVVEKHLDRLYKAIGELTEATKAIASAIKASEDTTRGLVESMKGEIDTLKDELKKLAAGFGEAASANKDQDKFPKTGKAKVSETAEEVTYKPEGLRERGAEMLEKSKQDIVKSSVMTPRPTVANTNVSSGSDKAVDLVKAILSGQVKPGEIPAKVREVMAA